MVRLISIVFMLFICGCSDFVGSPKDFVCPVCKKQAGQLSSKGESTEVVFALKCTSCKTTSGQYKSFLDSTKVWKLGTSEGISKGETQ